MRRYFINPELKRCSVILLVLMILFFTATFLLLNLHGGNLKDDYIKCLGAVASRVIEMYPEAEADIIPLITRGISEQEALKGKEFLRQYGLSGNLENVLFPYVNSTTIKNDLSVVFVFAVMTLVLFILNYIQYGFFYERIRRLTIGAKKVVEGEYNISISEDREGDLSKLAFSFNSMREVIRNSLSELKKEKQFLADLLSDISHQLKTPLSSMVVYNDIMLNKELSKEQRKTFLLSNQNQLNRMEWLIKSLLKLARLDAKAIELNKENQSLNETIQESLYALENKAYEGNIKSEIKEKEEIFFEHDRLWLEEAFINIIKNCIEHIPEGGEIYIELKENPVYKRVLIKDTGEGIAEDDLPNIFKRFYKAKSSKKSDSIGIGLALAKSIIELHNGIIEVQSKIGEGTAFTVTFYNA
jgi:signal transduction histidine kinase